MRQAFFFKERSTLVIPSHYDLPRDRRDEPPRRVAEFSSAARAMALREETLVRASPTSANVELCNLQGVVKQKISFSEGEGSPTHLDMNNKFLAVATSTGLIKIFQVDRREPKQIGSPGRFDLWASKTADSEKTNSKPGHAIRSIRCNSDGTRVSILADRVHGKAVRIREPDTRLYVYDADRDIVDSHDFGELRRYPVSHYWDPREPKLVACETRSLRLAPETTAENKKANRVEEYNSLGLANSLANADEERSVFLLNV